MTDVQTENSKKLFNLTKLAEKAETNASLEDAGDDTRLKKFFRPTILNLADMQEPSQATV